MNCNKDKKKKKKITSALHAEGREFEPRQNLVYFFLRNRDNVAYWSHTK